jgi:hypothetical protein
VGARESSGDGSRDTHKSEAKCDEEPGCMNRANLGRGDTLASGAWLTSHRAMTEGRVDEGP